MFQKVRWSPLVGTGFHTGKSSVVGTLERGSGVYKLKLGTRQYGIRLIIISKILKTIVPLPTHRGSTTTVRPKFTWNFKDCKIAVWKDIRAPNLLLKFIFTALKIAWNFEQKYFFRDNLKPIIIPWRTPKSSAQDWNFEDFAIFPAVSKLLAIFRVFTFLFNFYYAVFKIEKNAFWQQVLGLGIFPYN